MLHLGAEFKVSGADLASHTSMPSTGKDALPAGAVATGGASVYARRDGSLVLAAVDRGANYLGCVNTKCESDGMSIKTCTTSAKYAVNAWHSVVVAVTSVSAALYVGGGVRPACEVSLPNGLFIEGNRSTEIYTQCRNNDWCKGDAMDSAAPHKPAAANVEMFDLRVSHGVAAVAPGAGAGSLVAAVAARAGYTPPDPDAWRARCEPACKDPNMFLNHVPIPQGKWRKIMEPRSFRQLGCRPKSNSSYNPTGDYECKEKSWCCASWMVIESRDGGNGPRTDGKNSSTHKKYCANLHDGLIGGGFTTWPGNTSRPSCPGELDRFLRIW